MVSLVTDPSVTTEGIDDRLGAGSANEHSIKLQKNAQDPPLSQRMFQIYVSKAFDDSRLGNTDALDEMKRQFSINPREEDAPTALHLQSLLNAIMHDISKLDNGCADLVRNILDCQWINRSETFVGTYIRFLGTLTSAHASYISWVMRSLVSFFGFVPSSALQGPGESSVSRELAHTRAHIAIQYVLELVPTSRTVLFPILVKDFPHKSESIQVQISYITNLLKIADFLPSLQGQIVGLMIDKIIQIDVEIQVELEDIPDPDDILGDVDHSSEAGLVQSSLAADPESDKFDAMAGSSDDDDIDDEYDDEPMSKSQTISNIHQLVSKLDAMLLAIFDYLNPILTENTSSSDTMFNYLINAFNNTILSTFRSRYTQFVLFWASQLNSDFTDIFLGILTENALDPSKPMTTRVMANMYIGSYVSRARTLTRSTVRIMVGMLLRWLEAYLDEREFEVDFYDTELVTKYAAFYGVCQSVFYIFCFRWRELQGQDDEETSGEPGTVAETGWIPGVEILHRAILSRLNPLKYCSPIVVRQFADLSLHFNLFYCHSRMEQNERSMQSGREKILNIDSYFPFDPYQLERSRIFIENMYNSWERPPDMEVEESSSSDEEDEEDEVDDESMLDSD